MAASDLFVILFAHPRLAGRVDAVLRGTQYACTAASTPAEVRKLLIEGHVPTAIVADTYDPALVALAPALPWVWLADPKERFDRGVVLSVDHLDELPSAIAAAINLARCELALRLFRRRPALDTTNEARPGPSSDAFEMYFQPRWSMDGSRITGAEALLRWHGLDPNLGTEQLVSSDDLPLVRLGDWILMRTLGHLASFRTLWPNDAVMSMNVSVAQLADPHFGDLVAEQMRAQGIPSDWLEVDVDVDALNQLKSVHVANLLVLRSAGIGIVADGVGYRPFDPGRFAHLPLTGLKIDRALIAGLPARPHAVALTRRIVELANRLSIAPVAVGVETPEQREILQAAGCAAFQGFLLAEPMPPAELDALLAAHRESRGAAFTGVADAPIVAQCPPS